MLIINGWCGDHFRIYKFYKDQNNLDQGQALTKFIDKPNTEIILEKHKNDELNGISIKIKL